MDSRPPLEIPRALSPDITPDTDLPKNYFNHPDLPNKVIRWQNHTSEVVDELPYITRLLDDLEQHYGIPTVHTQFVVSEEGGEDPRFIIAQMPGSIDLVMISDKIEHSITAEDALKLAATDESIADEFDATACGVLHHLADVQAKGGVFMPDYYHYHQFVLDTDRPVGKRLVLVDTEPIFTLLLEPPESRIKGSVPLHLLMAAADVARDIIQLEKATNQISNAQLLLKRVVDKFDSEGHEPIERMKQAIVAAVQQEDQSLLDFIDEEWFDGSLFSNVTESAYMIGKLKSAGGFRCSLEKLVIF